METTEQTPEYIWQEPTTSWKTQEEIDQYNEFHKKFIHIGEDNIVKNVIVASHEFINTNPYGNEICIEYTSDINGQPMIGYLYNEELNAFIPPKPYESWILNQETWQWESPVPKPTA